MSEQIKYTIKHSKKAKRMTISINCDAQVLVTAPAGISVRYIEKVIKQKTDWILKSLEKFKNRMSLDKPEHLAQGGYNACVARTRKFVKERLEHYNKHYNFKYNRIAIRRQKTRWGSCSGKSNLNFNYKILFLPPELADYIIVHELCHLKEMNHGKNFWKLVSEVIPDYKERRKRLRGIRLS